MTDEPVGLIAGSGRVPVLVAEGIRREGHPLVVVGLRGQADPHLRELAQHFDWAGVTRIGRWARLLRGWGVRRAVMVGGVRKADVYSRFRLLRHIPDVQTAKLWYRTLRHDHRDHSVLLGVTNLLAQQGIELVSSVQYCREHLAGEGLMTQTPVPRGSEADAEFGFRIARASAELDVGQSVAVKDGDIIAVEAIEGTDRMIRRSGRLCRRRGWTLVKVARPGQDMRFDVPAVGPQTIRRLKDSGGACLVLEAGRTLIIDKPDTLKLADELGIAVLGKIG